MVKYLLTCLIAILFCAVLPHSTFARIQEDLDSIETALKAMPDDSDKVHTYGKLFLEFEFVDTVRARYFLSLGLHLAQDLDYKVGIGNMYMQFGFLNDDIGKYDKALEYYEKSLAIRIELDDQRGIAIMYNNMGIIYKEQGRYPEALEFYHKALAIAEKSADKRTMALAYNNIGVLYDDQHNNTAAATFYKKSMTIAEELGNKLGVADAHNNLAIIYDKQNDHITALESFQKAIDIYQEIGYMGPGVASAYNNIGFIYFEHPDLTNNSKENYLKSLEYHRKSLELREKIGDQEGIAVSFINIGKVFTALANYKNANEHLNKALVLTKKIGSPNRRKEVFEALSTLYERSGNYEKALENFKYFTHTKDSLFNEEKSKDLGKLEAKHEFETAETERKRDELARLKAATQVESRRNNLQYSGILIFMVLVFTGVFFLGKLSIPIRLAEGMIFFAFLLFFEFTLVLLDPYIEQYSAGAPAIKLAFNALLAAMIFPLHSFFEERLKGRMVK